MEMFSMRERRKSKCKFGGTKICEADKIGEHFINPKVENEVFDECVKFSLDIRNITCIKFELDLISVCLSELLSANYLRAINISCFICQ